LTFIEDTWHRNVYVAIAVRSVDQKLNWKVIKHSWRDTPRRFDELDIFRKIYASSEGKLCTAGIVRVDLDESRTLGMDNTPDKNAGESVNRRRVLIVMKPLGKALSSCSSVMKNLKAMYDLVESMSFYMTLARLTVVVDRMLVEAPNSPSCQPNERTHRRHPYRRRLGQSHLSLHNKISSSKCRGEKKVHATSSDFDCACILGSNEDRESETTGEIKVFCT
jgi:hypothetical protein